MQPNNIAIELRQKGLHKLASKYESIKAGSNYPWEDDDGNITLDTMDDARTWWSNSGIDDWEWFEGFDSDELIDFMLDNAKGLKSQNELVSDFLKSKGENPSDYNL